MAQMSTVEILEAARKRISRRSQWAQGIDAAFPQNGECCAALAISEVCEDRKRDEAATDALAEAMGVDSVLGIVDWNDSHTHKQVLAAFTRAIKAERAKVSQ